MEKFKQALEEVCKLNDTHKLGMSKEEIDAVIKMFNREERDISELAFMYLSPICESLNLDLDEVTDDIKRHVNKINAFDAVLGMRVILSRIWMTDMYKEIDAIDWKTAKENIFKTTKMLDPHYQYLFIRKVAGAQGYFMLWLLLDEMNDKEMLVLERRGKDES